MKKIVTFMILSTFVLGQKWVCYSQTFQNKGSKKILSAKGVIQYVFFTPNGYVITMNANDGGQYAWGKRSENYYANELGALKFYKKGSKMDMAMITQSGTGKYSCEKAK